MKDLLEIIFPSALFVIFYCEALSFFVLQSNPVADNQKGRVEAYVALKLMW